MFSISEAAEFLGVSTMTLRRWEAEGKLVPMERTKGGHRKYTLSQLKEFLKARKALEKTVEDYENEIYIAVQKIANGLFLLHQQLSHKQPLYLPTQWKEGTAFLFHYSQMTKSQITFPLNLVDQLQLLKKPLPEWPFKGFDMLFKDEEDITGIKPIIYNEQNFDYAEVLQFHYGRLELTSKFVEFMKECRLKKKFDEYTNARRFLIEFPVLDERLRTKCRSALYNLPLDTRELVKSFYEEMPANRIDENNEIHLCPYCHAPLKITNAKSGKQFICRYYKCKYYIDKQTRKKSVSMETITYVNQKKIKSEILHAITIPGISEVRLYEHLKKISTVENVQLFPEGDVGDIAFHLNGDSILLDVKDYLNAHQLLMELNGKGIYRLPKKKYKDLYIVIPKFHSKKYVQYIQRKLNSEVVYKVIHEKDLLKICKGGEL